MEMSRYKRHDEIIAHLPPRGRLTPDLNNNRKEGDEKAFLFARILSYKIELVKQICKHAEQVDLSLLNSGREEWCKLNRLEQSNVCLSNLCQECELQPTSADNFNHLPAMPYHKADGFTADTKACFDIEAQNVEENQTKVYRRLLVSLTRNALREKNNRRAIYYKVVDSSVPCRQHTRTTTCCAPLMPPPYHRCYCFKLDWIHSNQRDVERSGKHGKF